MNNTYSKIIDTLPHMKISPCHYEPPLEHASNYIEKLDLTKIQKKLCSGGKLISRCWTPAECEIAIQYYKNFLFLNKKYLKIYPIIPPSIEIDEIWHQHILDTRQYTTDCQRIFGYYFHHFPEFGSRNEQDKNNLNIAFKVTQQLHFKEFGSHILSIREGTS